MSKKVAILQSNYIPWKGYFDLMAAVDEFIIYDEVQYTVRDWRNRNIIQTPQGPKWLTIPVHTVGRFRQRICDVEIADSSWAQRHWKSICSNYGRAPHFKSLAEKLEQLYLGRSYKFLSDVNRTFIEFVRAELGIQTALCESRDYSAEGRQTERLVNLCKRAEAVVYISGPAARNYLDPDLFAEAGIELLWFDYDGYRSYQQCFEPFEHKVSIIDLLFCCGASAPLYMRYVK